MWFFHHEKLLDKGNLKIWEVWAKQAPDLLERTPDDLLVNSHLAKIRKPSRDKVANEFRGNHCNSFI